MGYRDVLSAVHALQRMGQSEPPTIAIHPDSDVALRFSPPTCPDHPTSSVQWSSLREAWNCSTCRRDLGDPDPNHLSINDVL